MNEDQIMHDMYDLFQSMLVEITVGEHMPMKEFDDVRDDYRRWIPDRIVDPSELVHQIEVK